MVSCGCMWRPPLTWWVVMAAGPGRWATAERPRRCGICRWRAAPPCWCGSSARWCCPEPDCAMGTWSETSPEIAVRAVLTERARRRLADMVNIEGWSIAAAGVEFGVGWHTANRAVADYTDPASTTRPDLRGWRRSGSTRNGSSTPPDSAHHLHNPDRRPGPGTPVGRGRGPLPSGPRRLAPGPRRRLVPPDPAGDVGSAGYRAALEDHLPNVTLVVDHFHAIRLANRAIDEARRRVQNRTLGHRGHKADPLYRARRVLLTGYERLTPDRFAWMQSLLAAGDPDGEVSACFVAKELLRDVYAAIDEAHARRRMITFYLWCADADVPELTRLASTISVRAEEIFAYHRTSGASNGRVESIHMLVEKTRRTAHGFTNPTHYRRRLLGRLGIKWHTQPTARIRGRQPRFIA